MLLLVFGIVSSDMVMFFNSSCRDEEVMFSHTAVGSEREKLAIFEPRISDVEF
jgi:hypothetical protein